MQLEDVARVCNRYPDIQLTYQLEGGNSVAAKKQVTLTAQMERELEGDLRPVDAPRSAACAVHSFMTLIKTFYVPQQCWASEMSTRPSWGSCHQGTCSADPHWPQQSSCCIYSNHGRRRMLFLILCIHKVLSF